MKKFIACLAVAGLVMLGGQAFAEIGTIDAVPAATLLLPYFEVDLNNANGVTTLFSINNASAAPAIAHVVLWTDLSIPTLDFDIYLTGYDVQTINIRDIFDGKLPITAHPQADAFFNDTISPSPPGDKTPDPAQATFWDNPAKSGLETAISCANKLPFDDPALSSTLIAHIRNAHTGEFSNVLGGCSAQPYGDGIARGYITVDSVSQCSLEFPDRATGYWTNTANTHNVLWGDWFLADPANNFAQGETLVHIEACADINDPFATGPSVGIGATCPYVVGDYTFYGRWTSQNPPASARDQREPLGTTYATRYLADSPPFDGSYIIAWRDAKQLTGASPSPSGPFDCVDFPPGVDWYPLEEQEVTAFDEEEHFMALCGGTTDEGPVSPPQRPTFEVCFPAETQRVPVVGLPAFGDPLDVPFDFGWLFLNLNHTNGNTNTFGGVAQSWITVLMSATGRFSVGIDAIALDNANDYAPTFLGGDTPTIVPPQMP